MGGFLRIPACEFRPALRSSILASGLTSAESGDAYMHTKEIDYFENSRRATYSQRAYATANPDGWKDYGPDIWGLTAGDGPFDTTIVINGRPRKFFTYSARGAASGEIRDDGTIAPTAAGGSIAFAPEIAIPALIKMREKYGDDLFSTYGFVDDFDPTLSGDIKPRYGKVVPALGWFDTDYLGIDQGPIIAMIENYRSDLIWKTMRKSLHRERTEESRIHRRLA